MKVYLKKDSQNDMILDHLMAFGQITPMEAVKKYEILRLAGRIFELKRAGVRITTDYKEGGHKRYAVYKLADDQCIQRVYAGRSPEQS